MMDWMLDAYYHIRETHEYVYTFADKRVESWLLMQAYWPTLLITAGYLFIVWVGPKIMRNREPIKMPLLLFIYNMGLVVLNFHIFYELLTCSYRLGYSYSCQLVDYSYQPDEYRIAKALWWYYFSKCIEFADTFFFILRKKNNQVSFLHVYHHATMFPIWWIGVKWVAGGQAFLGAMMNSFIHVLMYTYYGVSALGPEFQKFLWWKKYLTRIQLVQFVAGMIHAAQSILLGCPFPLWMQWALILYGASILSLFLNFYFHAYIKGSKPNKVKAENGSLAKNGIANGKEIKKNK